MPKSNSSSSPKNNTFLFRCSPYFWLLNIFASTPIAPPQIKVPKSKLADNDIWDPHVIGSNLCFSHPPYRGQDAKEMRALGASPVWWRRGCVEVAHRQIYLAVEVGGGGREHDSGDRCWREVGEAASPQCGGGNGLTKQDGGWAVGPKIRSAGKIWVPTPN